MIQCEVRHWTALVADIATIFASLGALAAVVIGWRAYSSWKDQLRGTHQYELAKRLLTRFSALHHALLQFLAYAKPTQEELKDLRDGPKPKDEIIQLKEDWSRVERELVKFETEATEAKFILDDRTTKITYRILNYIQVCGAFKTLYVSALSKMPDPAAREPTPEEEEEMWEMYHHLFTDRKSELRAIGEFVELGNELETCLKPYLLRE